MGVIALALATTGGGPSQAAPAQPAAGQLRVEPDPTVTLITGDKVRLHGGDPARISITAGPGRKGMRFGTYRANGELSVIPADLATEVAKGRVDRRLFGITGLIKAGYDDAHSRDTALLLTYRHRGPRPKLPGATVLRSLPAVNGAAVRLPKARPWTGLAEGIDRIWLDGKRRPLLDRSVRQIGAPAAWQAGHTGKGVTVAVIDTGIDAAHPDLAGQVVAARNFIDDQPGDNGGHGTHVASTVAGRGDPYRGVAPDAKLLDAKVCDVFGQCPDSAIIAAMEWAAVEKSARVINVSLGEEDTAGVDPVEAAINRLSAQTGALFVVAGGNDGPGRGTMGSPATAEAALAVGAVDGQDGLAWFSSRGPRLGDGGIKPDVTAPGVGIVAARAADTELGEPVGEGHTRLSGTSMASPHVAGAAALLAGQHPDWRGDDLKGALMAAAKPIAGQTVFEQGSGRVDLGRAIGQSVVSVPGSISFGVVQWPHTDDAPVARELTYRNLGPTEVGLSVTATISSPDGSPAPAGALGLDQDRVTIPAGGTATVRLTSDTRHNGPDGAYTGRVVATGGGSSVVTPIAVVKEVESYDVTVNHTGPDGRPTEAVTALFGLDGQSEIQWLSAATTHLRLPKGEYIVDGRLDTGDASYHVVRPKLLVDKALSVTTDFRRTRPVSITVPRPEVKLVQYELGYSRKGSVGGLDAGVSGDTLSGLYVGSAGDPAPADHLKAYNATSWAVPSGEDKFHNSPYVYRLFSTRTGSYFDGDHRVVRDAELAKVTTTHHADEPGGRSIEFLFGAVPGASAHWSTGLTFDRPFKVVNFLEAGEVSWGGHHEVEEGPDWTLTGRLRLSPRNYPVAGSYLDSRWAAVSGPLAVAGSAVRAGNELTFNVWPYADAAGNAGATITDSAVTKLYRDGLLVAEAGGVKVAAADLPAGEGEFRAEQSVTRSLSPLSTRTDSVWTFRSGQAGAEGLRLPIRTIRFQPDVDSRNTARRTKATALPFRLDVQSGAVMPTASAVDVQTSGDDGTTWTRAVVRRTGPTSYVALFATPRGAFVSLKASAVDSAGNTTKQTITRAYRLG